MKDSCDKVSFYYMRDNFTSIKLTGKTPKEIAEKAREHAKNNPYGMLCPAIVLSGKKELRRVGGHVHANRELKDTAEWERLIQDDLDITVYLR